MPLSRKEKTVRAFGWASLLHDIGGDMIYSIWPTFVTGVLGAPVSVLGFIDGISDAMVSLSQAAAGYLSDRIKKRKIFIWMGYLFGALSRFGYAFSVVWQTLIPFRILDRAGKMRGSPRDAMIADISDHTDRARNFGYLMAMDNIGAVFGVILAIILLPYVGYRALFLIAVIPSLVAVGLIFFGVKEEKKNEKLFVGISMKNAGISFRIFLLVSALFSLATFSYSFLLVYASKFGISDFKLPIFYLLFMVLASWSSLKSDKLSDRFGRRSTIALAMIFWAALCVLLTFWHSPLGLIVIFILFGLHKGIMEPVQKTLAAELSPPDSRATALGVFQLVTGLCAFPASFIAGMLWDTVGPIAPLIFSFGITCGGLLLLPLVTESEID